MFTFLLLLGALLGVGVATTPVHAAGLAVDGAASTDCGSAGSCQVTLTTSSPNDVIIVFASNGNPSDSFGTPSDSQSLLSFTSRATATNGAAVIAEEWYAIASTALTGDTITLTAATVNSHAVFSLNVWGIVGANTASPFDNDNGALPALTKGSSFNNGTPGVFYINPVTVSTSVSNDMILCLVGGAHGSWGAAGGFTLLDSPDGHSGAGEYKVVSSTQTDLNAVFEGPSTFGVSYILVGDAVEAAATSTSTTSTVTATSDTTSSASTTSNTQTPVSSTTSTITGSPIITNTLSTTTTTTGSVASTSTTTFTSPLSTSYSTTSSVSSSTTSYTQTGTAITGTSQSETTTSTSTSYSTTTSGGTVTVTETDTFSVLLTQIFQELEQFEALILQTLGFQVTATPVGQQVNQVVVTQLPTTTTTVSSTQTVSRTSTLVATSTSSTRSTVTAPAVSVSLTLSPVVTGTVSTTVTVTGHPTGTFTATSTQLVSTSTSTSQTTFSAFTTGSETGQTTSTTTGTVTSSSTSFSTTTSSGTVQVTQTDIFTEIITSLVQVLHQILVGILVGFRSLVTVFKTPVGRIVHRVTVVK